MLKSTKHIYDTCTWLCIIILVFIIGGLFNHYFNDPKPIINSEHFYADSIEGKLSISPTPIPSSVPFIKQSKKNVLNPLVQEYSKIEPKTSYVPVRNTSYKGHIKSGSTILEMGKKNNNMVKDINTNSIDRWPHPDSTGIMGFSFNEQKYSSIDSVGLTPTPSP